MPRLTSRLPFLLNDFNALTRTHPFLRSRNYPTPFARLKGLAFIKDPDGYWIEIIHQGAPRATRPDVDCCGVHIDGGGGYTGGGDGSAAKK